MADVKSPVISVVIPAYNAETTIEACINSILGNDFKDIEILVVDDVSTDNTAELVNEIVRRRPETVSLIRMSKNGGPACCRNAGAAQARGEFLFFVDSDTEMDGKALIHFLARIEASKADVVCGIYSPEPLNAGSVPLYKGLLFYYFFTRQGVFEYEVFTGQVGGMRRTVFEAVGGYNEAIKWGMDFENEDLGHRLYKDYKMLLDPKVRASHHFPGFVKLTKTYYTRVASWMTLFLQRRQFENGGMATQKIGLATVSIPVLLAMLPFGLWYPWINIVTLFLAFLYLMAYRGFFGFVAKQRPFFLPMAVILNLWFSCVISAGASVGTLRYLFSRSP